MEVGDKENERDNGIARRMVPRVRTQVRFLPHELITLIYLLCAERDTLPETSENDNEATP